METCFRFHSVILKTRCKQYVARIGDYFNKRGNGENRSFDIVERYFLFQVPISSGLLGRGWPSADLPLVHSDSERKF